MPIWQHEKGVSLDNTGHMNQLQLFLPCAGGVEPLLADEVRRTVDSAATESVQAVRGGVLL
ncbi:MAG: hypothetical protein RL758_1893, partial [Pseudomonadota bacterium]